MPETITQLYAEFEQTLAALNAMPRKRDGSDAEEKRYRHLLDACNELSFLIVETRAQSVEEMLLKIAVGGWSAGITEPLDRWTVCADLNIADCLVSIRADLQAMLGKPSRSVKSITKHTRVGARRRAVVI
jgi:hypothetical protein